MSYQGQPIDYVWWLVSRAAGVVALVLISLSVVMGLAMTTKLLQRPGLKRKVMKLHEHVALSALAAIGAHGFALLGDHWLKPGLKGIVVPFAMSYRPQFTGLGILAGYLTLLMGPSFYLRRRIGARRWRQLHRLIWLVWLASAVHALGAGTDAHRVWLVGLVIATGIPIVYLLALRAFGGKPSPQSGRARSRPASGMGDDRLGKLAPGTVRTRA